MLPKLRVLKQAIKMAASYNIKYKATSYRMFSHQSVTTNHQWSIQRSPDPIPGIGVEEFQTRRSKLMQMVIMQDRRRKVKQNHIVVLHSPAFGDRSNKNKDMMYFAGINNPNTCIVLVYLSNGEMKTLIFTDDNYPYVSHIGGNFGTETLTSCGIDEIYPFSQMHAYLHGLCKTLRTFQVWYDGDHGSIEVKKMMMEISSKPGNVGLASLRGFIQKLRLFKSPAELKLLQKSCDITSTAFNNAMTLSTPGVDAYTLQAMIQRDCKQLGASRNAFSVGHPVHTQMCQFDAKMPSKKGDIVTVDAGCEYNGYTTDLTRTWPLSGEFTALQKLLYSRLYRTHQSLLQCLRVNSIGTMEQLFHKMCTLLGKELRQISFMKSATATDIAKIIPKLCPRNFVHFVGMDLNDTPGISRCTALAPGMVIALKPGLVIPKNIESISKNYQGLSMQLQDNIVLTEDGIKVLSSNCIQSPKEIRQYVGINKENSF